MTKEIQVLDISSNIQTGGSLEISDPFGAIGESIVERRVPNLDGRGRVRLVHVLLLHVADARLAVHEHTKSRFTRHVEQPERDELLRDHVKN